MNISRKSGARILVLAVAAVGLLTTGLVPAQAETTTTHEQDIPFSRLHPCTFEDTVGDNSVHMVFTVTQSDSGNMNVHVLQRTQGHQLVGAESGDTYNFNEAVDVHDHFQVSNAGGHFFTRTGFIHHGEARANNELVEGLDDWHQRLYIFIDANGVPTVTKTEAECR